MYVKTMRWVLAYKLISVCTVKVLLQLFINFKGFYWAWASPVNIEVHE
jgi:hypothetical protein